jgi:GT2 family glycosyltransferase
VIVAAAEPAPRPPAVLAAEAGLAANFHWLVAAVGRAHQQNAGARLASRDLLWFLHADSRLTANTLPALTQIHARHFLAYFRLRFGRDGPWLARLNAFGANLRSHRFWLPFGDQGLLMPRTTFLELGGFDEQLALGEDLDLVLRARAAGLEMLGLDATLESSARRYREQGWLATTLRHACLTWSLTRASRARIAERRA